MINIYNLSFNITFNIWFDDFLTFAILINKSRLGGSRLMPRLVTEPLSPAGTV